MYKILLVCSAGMSTSMLVEKMELAASKLDEKIEIKAKSIAEAQQTYDRHWDIVMLGPQISYIKKTIEDITGKLVVVIPRIYYAMAKGPETLKFALDEIKKANNLDK